MRTFGPSIHPSAPIRRLAKVSVRYVFVFVTSRAAWISSLTITTAPKQAVRSLAARRIALNRLAGPSDPMTVHGRIEPVTTTGFVLRTVRSSQEANRA